MWDHRQPGILRFIISSIITPFWMLVFSGITVTARAQFLVCLPACFPATAKEFTNHAPSGLPASGNSPGHFDCFPLHVRFHLQRLVSDLHCPSHDALYPEIPFCSCFIVHSPV